MNLFFVYCFNSCAKLNKNSYPRTETILIYGDNYFKQLCFSQQDVSKMIHFLSEMIGRQFLLKMLQNKADFCVVKVNKTDFLKIDFSKKLKKKLSLAPEVLNIRIHKKLNHLLYKKIHCSCCMENLSLLMRKKFEELIVFPCCSMTVCGSCLKKKFLSEISTFLADFIPGYNSVTISYVLFQIKASLRSDNLKLKCLCKKQLPSNLLIFLKDYDFFSKKEVLKNKPVLTKEYLYNLIEEMSFCEKIYLQKGVNDIRVDQFLFLQRLELSGIEGFSDDSLD